jgi:hypothetical protein
MSERLSDEQSNRVLLRAQTVFVANDGDLGSIDALNKAVEAAIVVALRAERAKPTPRDEERAMDLAFVGCGCSEDESEHCPDMGMVCRRPARLIAAAFASIRAEGSAARKGETE